MNREKTVQFSDEEVINEYIKMNNLNEMKTALNKHNEKVVIVSGRFAGKYDPYEILVHMKLKDELGKKIIDIHRRYLEYKQFGV